MRALLVYMSQSTSAASSVPDTEEEKYITLPAPCIRALITGAELELERLEVADPYNDHQVAKNAITTARSVVRGKDGEFAALPRTIAARLNEYATIIHANMVSGLLTAKAYLFEEFERRRFTRFTPM